MTVGKNGMNYTDVGDCLAVMGERHNDRLIKYHWEVRSGKESGPYREGRERERGERKGERERERERERRRERERERGM